MKLNVTLDREVDWDDIFVCIETENVNQNTVRMMSRDFKYIYTFVKKQEMVKATEIFKKFPKMDVEKILYDLRDMYLIYFVREVK